MGRHLKVFFLMRSFFKQNAILTFAVETDTWLRAPTKDLNSWRFKSLILCTESGDLKFLWKTLNRNIYHYTYVCIMKLDENIIYKVGKIYYSIDHIYSCNMHIPNLNTLLGRERKKKLSANFTKKKRGGASDFD